MRKKNKVKGYSSFNQFELDSEDITDLSRENDQNKLFETVYKICGLFIQSKYGDYLTGDICNLMLNSLMVQLLQTKNVECLSNINSLYAKECIKILDGNFGIDYRTYFYSYENEFNLEMKRTNIKQIISLRKSVGRLENELYKKDKNVEIGFSCIDEIENELCLITDLSDEVQRQLLNIIIYKIIKLYGYKLILSSDVFDSINNIVSEFLISVKNRDYYSDKNKDRTYMDKLIASLLGTYPKMASSTLDLYFQIGMDKIEEELGFNIDFLTFEELLKLEESGIKYMQKIQNVENSNKVYEKK